MPDAPIEEAQQARRERALERRNGRRARAVVLSLVFAGAALSVWQLPARSPIVPPEQVAPGVPAPPIATRDTIDRGESVASALMQAGLSRPDANAVVAAAATRVRARQEIPFSLYSDSAAAPIREVELQVADDRSIRVLRIGSQGWSAVERRELWRTDTVAVRGPIIGSLVETMRNAGRGALGLRGRLEMAYALAEAFEYKIDVGRDLRVGDSVVAVIERRRTAFGAERIGPLLAGGLYHERAWMRAIRPASVRR